MPAISSLETSIHSDLKKIINNTKYQYLFEAM
jgi:hypothetical protein